MERKFSEISNQENEYKTKTLAISIPSSLPCEICNKAVFDYRNIICNEIVCSYTCYSILMLSKKATFLHENIQYKALDTYIYGLPMQTIHENEIINMKRSPSFTDLVSEEDDKMETDK